MINLFYDTGTHFGVFRRLIYESICVFCGFSTSESEVFYFFGYDCKTFSSVTCVSSFNSSIQSQQVCLECDLIYRFNNFSSFLR